MNSSISYDNLYVTSVYMTTTSSSYGCLSLTCKNKSGETIVVRTQNAFYQDSSKKTGMFTGEEYLHKTINVKGIVDSFNGKPQIACFAKGQIKYSASQD